MVKNFVNKLTYFIFLLFRYTSDLELKCNQKNDRTIGIAIFGMGRAGTIHMTNLIRNPRVKVLYIVEDMESKWNDLKSFWRLDSIPILTNKQADQVYKDPKYVANDRAIFFTNNLLSNSF